MHCGVGSGIAPPVLPLDIRPRQEYLDVIFVVRETQIVDGIRVSFQQQDAKTVRIREIHGKLYFHWQVRTDNLKKEGQENN